MKGKRRMARSMVRSITIMLLWIPAGSLLKAGIYPARMNLISWLRSWPILQHLIIKPALLRRQRCVKAALHIGLLRMALLTAAVLLLFQEAVCRTSYLTISEKKPFG